MHRILFLCLLVAAHANSQIQFWTKDAIIDKQFESARKEMKIKTAINYITSEKWQVRDSTYYHEIFEYDDAGRKTVYKKYKTNWTTNKRFFQYIDSFFYNDKGVFTGMLRYNPKSDGDSYVLEYEARTIFDAKGRIARINYYVGYKAPDWANYDAYFYDTQNNLSKITSHDISGKKNYEWTFQYDNNKRLTKVRAGSEFGFKDMIIKYDALGKLLSYTELTGGKEKESETTYNYDAQGLLTKREYKTNYNYADTQQIWYRDNEKYFYRTYLKYPRPSGSDFSHEFLVYRFEYFE
jgi:YD repeat-containing protein